MHPPKVVNPSRRARSAMGTPLKLFFSKGSQHTWGLIFKYVQYYPEFCFQRFINLPRFYRQEQEVIFYKVIVTRCA